jgi:RNA 3'-terminal phosphate cyclase (ATP)
LCAVRAIRDLVGGTLEGDELGSQQFEFHPGTRSPAGVYRWDVGSAGSVTALALALLPVLTRASERVEIELSGGLFQDAAPSVFHLQHVVLPLLARMGMTAEAQMLRPGYVPRGDGVLRLVRNPEGATLQPLTLHQAGTVQRIWGIALSSHLTRRQVSDRMAEAARQVLAAAGHTADIRELDDTTAVQPGAALALFADRTGGSRLGADRAGAPHRRAEAIGARSARELLEVIRTGATIDRFAADQVLPFAALASGTSRVRIPRTTEHVTTGAWLAQLFLGAQVRIQDTLMTIIGSGAAPTPTQDAPSPRSGGRTSHERAR